MKPLRTLLLIHQAPGGSHYDWLLEDPLLCDERAPLWTYRLQLSIAFWGHARAFDLEPIGLHRREYLEYQGPLTGRRGSVRQIDRGWYLPRQCLADKLVLDLTTRLFKGVALLSKVSASLWRAQTFGCSSPRDWRWRTGVFTHGDGCHTIAPLP